jgi:hypothetical protein
LPLRWRQHTLSILTISIWNIALARAHSIVLSASLCLVLMAQCGPSAFAQTPSPTPDAASQDVAKSACESAKELGTTDAWNAFLANYSTGFYADMARAYLKKLTDTPLAAPPQPLSTENAQLPRRLRGLASGPVPSARVSDHSIRVNRPRSPSSTIPECIEPLCGSISKGRSRTMAVLIRVRN